MANQELISIQKISKTYRSGEVKVSALKNVSLKIYKKDFLIITGRNGSGKSTLLRQIGLLDKPDSGSIILNKESLVNLSEAKRAETRLKKLGYIFQDYALMSDLTVIENIMLPAMMLVTISEARQKAEKLAEKVGLGHRKNNLPSQLSGGEQQKVAIARALINDPEILIADEPTANLDSAAAKDVINIFKDLNEKEQHTIVMVTHEEEEEKYGSRIVTLLDGQIVNK
jgi:putative ABC transport system ATP-binding protein